MESRLAQGYRWRFLQLLAFWSHPPAEFSAARLVEEASARAAAAGQAPAQALWDAYRLLLAALQRDPAACASRAQWLARVVAGEPRFWCDASLGALARWVRAYGYEARWTARGSGQEALAAAATGAGLLLTSDARVLESGAARRGSVVTLWIPSHLRRVEQLALVAQDLDLERRGPRCMRCGGPLAPVAKDAVRQRIPPRTAAWQDVYFECRWCGRLLWRGSHWEKIEQALEHARPQGAGPGGR